MLIFLFELNSKLETVYWVKSKEKRFKKIKDKKNKKIQRYNNVKRKSTWLLNWNVHELFAWRLNNFNLNKRKLKLYLNMYLFY